MSGAGRAGLEAELDGAVAEGLDTLSDAQMTQLADALRSVRRRRARELETAVEDALLVVPRVLRGPVRRILLG